MNDHNHHGLSSKEHSCCYSILLINFLKDIHRQIQEIIMTMPSLLRMSEKSLGMRLKVRNIRDMQISVVHSESIAVCKKIVYLMKHSLEIPCPISVSRRQVDVKHTRFVSQRTVRTLTEGVVMFTRVVFLSKSFYLLSDQVLICLLGSSCLSCHVLSVCVSATRLD